MIPNSGSAAAAAPTAGLPVADFFLDEDDEELSEARFAFFWRFEAPPRTERGRKLDDRSRSAISLRCVTGTENGTLFLPDGIMLAHVEPHAVARRRKPILP